MYWNINNNCSHGSLPYFKKWRFINENIEEQIDFGLVAAQQTINTVNFGGI